VLACPFDALERTEDGVIKRHNMRCVSCKSCALACPFGTIYQELLPFYAMDYDAAVSLFVGARQAGDDLQSPDAVRTQDALLQLCRCNALEYREVDADDPDVHIVDGFLAARTRRWNREEREVAV